MNEIEVTTKTITFHGDQIRAIRHNGAVYTPAKPISDRFSLAWQVQHRKLIEHPVLSKGIIKMVIPSSGGMQEAILIRADKLPLWLIMINPNRVSEDTREMLTNYQEEAGRVLADAFLPKELLPQEWSAARLEGKAIRRQLTDLIAALVSYAASQGSQNSRMYYVSISKMLNQVLLEVKSPAPKNLRDTLNILQLHALSIGEHVLVKTIEDCILEGRPYKEIFPVLKEKIIALAEAVGSTKPQLTGAA